MMRDLSVERPIPDNLSWGTSSGKSILAQQKHSRTERLATGVKKGLSIGFLFASFFAFSQAASINYTKNVIPPSPDAAAIAKYGNTPVGLNTGVWNIRAVTLGEDDALKRRLLEAPQTQVTILTYAPLAGIASQTNPSEFTTFYTYDPHGRLRTVSDDKGDILRKTGISRYYINHLRDQL